MEVQTSPAPGREATLYTYHRPCFETPRALEDRVKALIKDIQNDMSQSDRQKDFEALERMSEQIEKLKALAKSCSEGSDCDAYDELLSSALDES